MAKDFQSQIVVDGYDTHIQKLIPGYALVHQQIHAILDASMTKETHVLIVGCGTGYEISYLLKHYPNWQFTAIDPSLTMLEKAKTLLTQQQGFERIRFIHGDTSQLDQAEKFDVALAILVAHFIPEAQKLQFFTEIQTSLKLGAMLLTYDLMQAKTGQDLNVMRCFAVLNGLSESQSQKMIQRLNDDFALIEKEAYQTLLERAGFHKVMTYCQQLSYYGFLAQK